MAYCEKCKDDVVHVWKYRRPTESMTHRYEEWRCAGCHPQMNEQLRQPSA